MSFPTINDCKPGIWAELTNGWIVGPIVESKTPGIYVKFDQQGGTWQLDVMGQEGVDESSPRLIKRIIDRGPPRFS